MIDDLLSFIAPHYCCGCGKIGDLLCSNCKNNIISESKMICIVCKRPTGHMWLCNTCKTYYQRVWVVGERQGILQRLIGLYKFERAQDAYKTLGDLLLITLPELPPDTIIIPVPTASSHIRERGYDHMLLIAKYIAKKRGLKISTSLYRKTDTKQRQSTTKQRLDQAKQAFAVKDKLDSTVTYLLIDDVITTGATIKYASKALFNAGAKNIWVAIIARQELK